MTTQIVKTDLTNIPSVGQAPPTVVHFSIFLERIFLEVQQVNCVLKTYVSVSSELRFLKKNDAMSNSRIWEYVK